MKRENSCNNILNINEWRSTENQQSSAIELLRNTVNHTRWTYRSCQKVRRQPSRKCSQGSQQNARKNFSLMRRCCFYLGRVWSGSLRCLGEFMSLVQKGNTNAGSCKRNSYKSGGTTHPMLQFSCDSDHTLHIYGILLSHWSRSNLSA